MNPIEDYTIDELLKHLPICGIWFLHKTNCRDINQAYSASWEETIDVKNIRYACYGSTPKEALYNLVKAVRGE